MPPERRSRKSTICEKHTILTSAILGRQRVHSYHIRGHHIHGPQGERNKNSFGFGYTCLGTSWN